MGILAGKEVKKARLVSILPGQSLVEVALNKIGDSKLTEAVGKSAHRLRSVPQDNTNRPAKRATK